MRDASSAIDTTGLAFLLKVHARLCAEYNAPIPYFGNRDPLSQLASSLLSQRTTNKNKSIAYKALVAALPT